VCKSYHCLTKLGQAVWEYFLPVIFYTLIYPYIIVKQYNKERGRGAIPSCCETPFDGNVSDSIQLEEQRDAKENEAEGKPGLL